MKLVIFYADDNCFSLVRDVGEGAAYSVFVMVQRVRHRLGVDGGPQRLQRGVRLPRLMLKKSTLYEFGFRARKLFVIVFKTMIFD